MKPTRPAANASARPPGSSAIASTTAAAGPGSASQSSTVAAARRWLRRARRRPSGIEHGSTGDELSGDAELARELAVGVVDLGPGPPVPLLEGRALVGACPRRSRPRTGAPDGRRRTQRRRPPRRCRRVTRRPRRSPPPPRRGTRPAGRCSSPGSAACSEPSSPPQPAAHENERGEGEAQEPHPLKVAEAPYGSLNRARDGGGAPAGGAAGAGRRATARSGRPPRAA